VRGRCLQFLRAISEAWTIWTAGAIRAAARNSERGCVVKKGSRTWGDRTPETGREQTMVLELVPFRGDREYGFEIRKNSPRNGLEK